MPEEETFEEQEAREDKEMTPLTPISSSSSDQAVMSPPPSMVDDLRQFQEMKWIADMLQILIEKVQESHHNLLDILHTSTSMKIAMLVNEALMEHAKTVW
ncbi:hypothetical protein UY3_02338 [Chelonia mydas]|uniref:Uncharacterized protein n=1 Tax=Chelonia mydas TaxID=8469 RepID=M7C7C9_CHEMY|nr:hypothetical protein UY3_02338 [Chelonia mydas]